jgi:hypothetical protein
MGKKKKTNLAAGMAAYDTPSSARATRATRAIAGQVGCESARVACPARPQTNKGGRRVSAIDLVPDPIWDDNSIAVDLPHQKPLPTPSGSRWLHSAPCQRRSADPHSPSPLDAAGCDVATSSECWQRVRPARPSGLFGESTSSLKSRLSKSPAPPVRSLSEVHP